MQYASAMLSEDGEITIWGETNLPHLVKIDQKFVDISMGKQFMLALTDENRLYAFGSNYFGQCGQGTSRADDPDVEHFIEHIVEVKNLHNLRIKQISAGDDHCLIKCSKI